MITKEGDFQGCPRSYIACSALLDVDLRGTYLTHRRLLRQMRLCLTIFSHRQTRSGCLSRSGAIGASFPSASMPHTLVGIVLTRLRDIADPLSHPLLYPVPFVQISFYVVFGCANHG